jgi:uncharacterized membrane protein YdjX (TVP38/TMEM64 family)
MKNYLRRFSPLFIFLMIVGITYANGWHTALTFDELQNQKEAFQSHVNNMPFLSAVIFMGIYIICVTLSLPIASLLTLLGGFLFGLIQGTLMVVTAATIGATFIFLIAKTSLGKTLSHRAGPLYQRIEGNMRENALGYMLFMRLVPLFPFVLVNIVPALFNIPLRIFVITTFIGIIPGTAAYVYFGQELGDIEHPSDLLSPEMLLAFGILGIFALIPTLYKQWKRRSKNDK